MKTILADIQDQFGVQELPHGLFHAFDNALRFDLGGTESNIHRPMRRFCQAYERACTIAHAHFEDLSEIYLLLASYGLEQPSKRRLNHIELCGVERSEVQYVSKTAQQDEEHMAEFGCDQFRHWDIVKVNDKRSISDIMWLCIASEMMIEPAFHSTTAYLVDTRNGLILHAYDDRGLDVVSLNKSQLSELFIKFNKWLLECDLARMSAMFASDD